LRYQRSGQQRLLSYPIGQEAAENIGRDGHSKSMTSGLTRLLAASSRSGKTLLALAILGGILLPPAAHLLRGLVPVAVVGLSTLVLLRVDVPATLAQLRWPVRLAAVLTVQMLACPMLAWAVTQALPLGLGIADAVVLFATGPAIVSAPAYARLLGLDAELSLLGALVGTLLVPLTAPPIAWALTDLDLAIGMGAFVARLATVVGMPLLLSLIIRRIAGATRLDVLGPTLDGLTVWLLVAFGVGVMDGVGARLLAEPAWVLKAMLVACVASAGLNLATAAVLLPFGTQVAATAGMLSGFRSMALYLAVLPATADPRVALFFGLYQIPLYVGPLIMMPIYRRLLQHHGPPI
jgi:predicted Na+-dependent transporter